MKFKPYYITSAQLELLPIVPGQFIVVTDTKSVYFDETTTDRIDVSSGVSVLTNNLFWNDSSEISDMPYYLKPEIDEKIGKIVAAMELL